MWRKFSEQDVVIPPPLPDPTPVQTRLQPQPQPHSQLRAPQPLPQQPLFGFPGPPDPPSPLTAEERKVRRRRVALIAAASLSASALLVAVLAGPITDALRRGVHQILTTPSGSATRPGARASAAETGSSLTSTDSSSDTAALGGGDALASPSASPPDPRPQPYPLVNLHTKNSVDLDDPTTDAKGRTGELRFGCTMAGCELVARTAVLELMPTETATTLDDCRTYLKGDKNHSIPLAAAANGSEICIRSAEGDIALLVIGVKSTAIPEAGFVQADMTIWRGAALER